MLTFSRSFRNCQGQNSPHGVDGQPSLLSRLRPAVSAPGVRPPDALAWSPSSSLPSGRSARILLRRMPGAAFANLYGAPFRLERALCSLLSHFAVYRALSVFPFIPTFVSARLWAEFSGNVGLADLTTCDPLYEHADGRSPNFPARGALGSPRARLGKKRLRAQREARAFLRASAARQR